MPPLGKVAERTIWIDSACKVHVDPVRVMDTSAFSTPLDDQSERSWAVSGARDSGPIPLTSYNGSAYAVERTWDCFGILLNELYSNLTFSGNGSVITSYQGWDGVVYHREGGGYTGWWPNSSDSYLRVVVGGIGSTTVRTEAHQGFNYQGVFDPTGTVFYNSYTEDISGFVYGTWLCSYSYYWRHSLVGWHLQQWCGAGTTNG